MSNLPKPHYTLWQALHAALAKALKALEEVRALRREPGPQGDPGVPGKDGMGFDDLSFAYDGARTISAIFKRGTEEKRFDFKIAIPLYVGRFKPGERYEKGDMLTYGGSLWHCSVPTGEKPGDGTSWQLCVKKGENGRDGLPGKDAMPPQNPNIPFGDK